MKVLSWNVNGLRACIDKGFVKIVKEINPEIICLQEIKAVSEQVKIDLTEYENKFWNPAKKKGYSGTAIFSKIKPLSIKYGFGILDDEGRVITLEFKDFYLVNVYTPNSKPDLSRLNFRYDAWDKKIFILC
jgi:exodeoxyribonuclease-3